MRFRSLLRASAWMLSVSLLAPFGTGCGGRTSGRKPQEGETGGTRTPAETADPRGDDATPAASFQATLYPDAAIPDYASYDSAHRLREALSKGNTAVFAVGAARHYRNGELREGGEGVLSRNGDGGMTVRVSALAPLYEGARGSDGTPAETAAAMGRRALVYDGKLVVFWEGDTAPLSAFRDAYTLEAAYLTLCGAGEAERRNAFIDLPDRIGNGTCNTVFYTAPDLNLGVQTSVYYPLLGDVEGVLPGPSLVCGEGPAKENHTVVRVFNAQQTCTAQFLAFDASVTGGVQVAAAQVGAETLIAAAPFAEAPASGGDVRVFDTFGTLRMTLSARAVLKGPYAILAGHFVPDRPDEALLVASASVGEDGRLPYLLISLSDGRILAEKAFDCGFAEAAGAEVRLTARRRADGAGTDAVVLFFPSTRRVGEGDPSTGGMQRVTLNVPEGTTAVCPSREFGERYVLTLEASEEGERKDRSYLIVYDDTLKKARKTDVGFRENVFYSARYLKEYNDDRYVNRCSFEHIRTDLGHGLISRLASARGSREVDGTFDASVYADYAPSFTHNFATRLRNEYLFLEPCFTHRWNKFAATQALVDYRDADGTQIHSSLGKAGEYVDYHELDSAYYIGTYADGNMDLAKLRVFPLRSFLRGTSPAFRGEGANPEHLVGISPVHEHEIDVAESVGDYNAYMIEGFRASLIERFGSVETINRLFGTPFADRASIDPPRMAGRGAWDDYAGDYFTEWALYNRYIVSKRIMEAYREALLAGYPPESISAHQIPEGEAVSGFLGQADTRISPIDVVLTCGTAYGGTRYSNQLRNNRCFLSVANSAGHNSITLGEYCSLNEYPQPAWQQLKFMWARGLRMVHHITFTDGQSAAEEKAVRQLEKQNLPRPGYTGGTIGSLGVRQGDGAYRIVQIGDADTGPSDHNGVGLLKSLNAEGKWEGTVYLAPFHARVLVTPLERLSCPKKGTSDVFTTGPLPMLKNSDQAEITFEAAYAGEGEASVAIGVYHRGCLIPASETVYRLTSERTTYRYCLLNQLCEQGMEIVVTFRIPDGSAPPAVTGTLQQDAVGIIFSEGTKAYNRSKPHRGGVTFDILSRDRVY